MATDIKKRRRRKRSNIVNAKGRFDDVAIGWSGEDLEKRIRFFWKNWRGGIGELERLGLLSHEKGKELKLSMERLADRAEEMAVNEFKERAEKAKDGNRVG